MATIKNIPPLTKGSTMKQETNDQFENLKLVKKVNALLDDFKIKIQQNTKVQYNEIQQSLLQKVTHKIAENNNKFFDDILKKTPDEIGETIILDQVSNINAKVFEEFKKLEAEVKKELDVISSSIPETISVQTSKTFISLNAAFDEISLKIENAKKDSTKVENSFKEFTNELDKVQLKISVIESNIHKYIEEKIKSYDDVVSSTEKIIEESLLKNNNIIDEKIVEFDGTLEIKFNEIHTKIHNSLQNQSQQSEEDASKNIKKLVDAQAKLIVEDVNTKVDSKLNGINIDKILKDITKLKDDVNSLDKQKEFKKAIADLKKENTSKIKEQAEYILEIQEENKKLKEDMDKMNSNIKELIEILSLEDKEDNISLLSELKESF